MRKKMLILVVDIGGGLINEWMQTCGKELIQVLLNRWEGFGAIVMREPLNIDRHIFKTLRQLGFIDTIDKLILRLGMACCDHMIVSDDSDFWDPCRPSVRGNKNAPVASICRERLGITILQLTSLICMLLH
jgi:hypothetical protein